MTQTPTPSRTVGPVTAAATAGSGTGYALGIVVVWVLSTSGVNVPGPVADAIGFLLTVGLSFAGGWLVPPGTGSRRA
ncbi:hypothetical protein [Paenarthrobacter ilicis]|uniref:hypothetical protein n=1 Tax=Paenarthrobacter ilicis TaxID=43665 RepID=UPI00386EE47E